MKTSERRSALARLKLDGIVYNAVERQKTWASISAWIRQMVKIEPRIMREVSKAEFGDLGKWIEKGKGNVKACGCLVGTVALEMVKQRNHFTPNVEYGEFTFTTNDFENDGLCEKGDSANAGEVVAKLAQKQFADNMETQADLVGGAAASLGNILGQEPAVALIKDEIVRALKRRSQAAKRRKLAHA